LILTVGGFTLGVSLFALGFRSGLLFLGLVPLLYEFVLPAHLVGDFVDPILDNCKSLAHLIILHVLLIIQLVGELKQLVNLSFLGVLLLLLSDCPRRLLALLFWLALNRHLLVL
jgi:hypothetical protein